MSYNMSSSLPRERLLDPHDREAWQEFEVRYKPVITAYARKAGCRQADIEDIAQNVIMTFLTALQNGKYDKDRGKLRAWLGKVAVTKTIDFLRCENKKWARERPQPDGSGSRWINQQAATDGSQAVSLWRRLWHESVLKHIRVRIKQDLSQEDFAIYYLLVHDALTPSQAAAHLGIKRTRVYAVRRKCLRLQEEYRKEFDLED